MITIFKIYGIIFSDSFQIDNVLKIPASQHMHMINPLIYFLDFQLLGFRLICITKITVSRSSDLSS